MQDFLKNLFGKKKRSTVPPSGDGGPPAHLIAELETKVNRLFPLVEGAAKRQLQAFLRGFQEDNLKAAIDAFIGFNQNNKYEHQLDNMGILLAAQANQLLIQQKDGLLDQQMLRQRKSGLLKSLLGFLDNVYQDLSQNQ